MTFPLTAEQVAEIEAAVRKIKTIVDAVQPTPVPAPTPAPVPQLMGLHILGATYYGAAAWPKAALTRLRLWDIWDSTAGNRYLSWDGMHKGPGQIDFSLFDAYVALARSKGVTDFLYTFGYTPVWARADRNRARAPTSLASWDEFCRAILTRAKATGLRWSFGIWNEPNSWPQEAGFFWQDSPSALAAMGARLYAIKKEIYPDALILSPETQGNGSGWMQSYMMAPGGKDWDVLGVHLYGDSPNYAAESKTYLAAHKAALAAVGLSSRPIWNTEFGWEARHGGTIPDYMRNMVAANKAGGIARAYWYAYDAPTGRLANPPTEVTDAMNAFRSIAY